MPAKNRHLLEEEYFARLQADLLRYCTHDNDDLTLHPEND
jgi:hypothetical protein